ncbi:PKD domain-containing protein [Thalassotalea psychrophila]|uniref:PKD domain-containing protein n=1 Tax=Thalassotalea psychrophila TaxID=3065647 RepID=A0ABY9TRY1_9GAMM|nr:PKD domain-containing protein [Colwelliaceae bacterium SQ149]
MKRFSTQLFVLLFITQLFACGGGGGEEDSNKASIANVAPTTNAGSDQTVNEVTTVSLTGSGTDSDGTIESYSWTQTDGNPVTLTNANTATATFDAPSTLVQLTLTFQLTVTDNEGATATDVIAIMVNPVNVAPSTNAGSDQTVNEVTTVSLTGSGTDSDGTIESYSWTQTDGNPVAITSADTATATFDAPSTLVQLTLTFQLTVTDNEGATATDSVIITVNHADYSVNVVFPKVSSLTDNDSIIIRGTQGQDVENLSVNGTDVDRITYQTEGFWTVELPLAMGENAFNVQYSAGNDNITLDAIDVKRVGIAVTGTRQIAKNDDDGSYYIYDDGTKSILHRTADGTNTSAIYQFRIEDFPNDDEFRDELKEDPPEGMVLSEDGSLLYYWNDFEDTFRVMAITLATGTLTELYGPDSAGYIDYDVNDDTNMLLDTSRGTAGQILLTRYRKDEPPIFYDIALKSIIEMDFPDLQTITASSRSFYRSVDYKDDNTLIVLFAKDDTQETYTAEVELASCDVAPCDFSNILQVTTVNDGCQAMTESYNKYGYHQASHSVVYYKYPKLCVLDIANQTISDLEPQLNDLGAVSNNLSQFNVADNELIFDSGSSANLQQLHYQLAANFPSVNLSAEFKGPDLTIGDATLSPTTPREVVINSDDNLLYWLDRKNTGLSAAQVHSLDLANNSWTTLGSYPSVSFEIATYNSVSSSLFVYNDDSSSDEEVFEIDVDTGDYTVLIGATEKATIAYPNFNVDSMALDEANQILYLARQIDFSDVPANFGRFSLLAWDIEKKVLTDVSPIVDITLPENVAQNNFYANYDMTFDPVNNQVIFYGTSYTLWAVDVTTGARRVFSAQDVQGGPDISNTRGHVIDIDNNRLLASSQDHESVFAYDLDTGERSFVSTKSIENGINLQQPIGIDLFKDDQVSVVADERIDALFMVDNLTGHRLLIQNQ